MGPATPAQRHNSASANPNDLPWADEGQPKGLKRQIAVYEATIKNWEPLADAASDFAMNMRAAAEARNLSIGQLAAKSGVSERTLWNILSMETLPQFSTIVFLARTLKVHHSDLLLQHRKFKAGLKTGQRRSRRSNR